MHTMVSHVRRLTYFFPVIVLTAVLGASGQSDLPPKGWKWVNPCSASFLVPSKLDKQIPEGRPIDSCFATYGDGKLVVSVNEDSYAPSFERGSDWQDYTESPITVGPLSGQLIMFRTIEKRRNREKIVSFTMLRLGIVRDNSATFSLVIRSDPSIDPATVNRIRETVRFKQPGN